MSDPAAGPRQPDPPRTWRNRLPEIVLALAGGLAVNALSVDVGPGGAVVVTGFAAVLLAANRIRWLRQRAPLVRITSLGSLLAALVAMMLAVLLSESWQEYAVIAAVMFATGAVLVPSDAVEALETVLRIFAIGAGVTSIGLGMATLAVGKTAAGVATLPVGEAVAGIFFIGWGVALLGLGVVSLRETTL